jgi:hypothetical protein
MTSVAGVGFWEHVDLLNLVAPFLEASAIGALSCTCRFARDNLHDPMQLRWLAELRGLDPERSGISSVEHIHIAEALSSMQTSVAFEYQSVRLVPAALPSVRRVADLLLQHTSLSISVEAHCGLEAATAHSDCGGQMGGVPMAMGPRPTPVDISRSSALWQSNAPWNSTRRPREVRISRCEAASSHEHGATPGHWFGPRRLTASAAGPQTPALPTAELSCF